MAESIPTKKGRKPKKGETDPSLAIDDVYFPSARRDPLAAKLADDCCAAMCNLIMRRATLYEKNGDVVERMKANQQNKIGKDKTKKKSTKKKEIVQEAEVAMFTKSLDQINGAIHDLQTMRMGLEL